MVTMSVEDPGDDSPLLPEAVEAVTPAQLARRQPLIKPGSWDFFFLSRWLWCLELNVNVWLIPSVTLLSLQEPEPGPRRCAALRMLLSCSDSCLFPTEEGDLPR